jgi:Ribbon-helix-helix domain
MRRRELLGGAAACGCWTCLRRRLSNGVPPLILHADLRFCRPFVRHKNPPNSNADVAGTTGGARRMKSSVVKHSVFIAGRRTSVSLEKEFWSALRKSRRIAGCLCRRSSPRSKPINSTTTCQPFACSCLESTAPSQRAVLAESQAPQ